ncbi:MAG: hypothetical protein WCQ72_04130 [Eubacteriales bacterium]
MLYSSSLKAPLAFSPFIKRPRFILRAAALLISAVLLVSSCASAQPDRLAFRRFPMEVAGSLTAVCGGESTEYGVVLSLMGEGNGVLRFASPERISGLCVTISPDGCIMRFGELEFPIAYGVAETARAVVSMFSITAEDMTSADKISAGSVKLNSVVFSSESGEICVYYGEDGSPVRFFAAIRADSEKYPLTGGTMLTLDVSSITYPEG